MSFTVFPDGEKNGAWWAEQMRNAKRNGLAQCRVGKGKGGRGRGSLWRPDLVAGWLVDRHEKRQRGNMNTDKARQALQKVPGCSDIAEELFPSEE